MSWKNDKNLGPWAFALQEDKRGYINNPRWTDEPNPYNDHKPCGYWPRPRPRSIGKKRYEYWANHNYAMTNGVTGWVVLGWVKDREEDPWQKNLLFAEEYDDGTFVKKLLLPVTGFPCMCCGVKIFEENSSYTIVYYGHHSEIGMRCIVVKDGIVFSDNIVFPDEPTYTNQRFNNHDALYADSAGLIICPAMLKDFDYVASPIAYYYTRRSTDFGNTWENRVEIYNSLQDCPSNCAWYYAEGFSIAKTLDGKFYFGVADGSYYGLAGHEWQWFLAKSSDNGQSWSQITSIIYPTDISEAGALRSLWMTAEGNELYISGKRVQKKNRLYITDDEGNTWTEYTFNDAGQINPDLLFTAVNGSTVLSITTTAISPVYDIMRSVDGGSSFSHVYTTPVAFNFLTRMENYGNLFKSGGWIYYSDDDYLAYLKSTNNGVTWEIAKLPLLHQIIIVEVEDEDEDEDEESISNIDPVWTMPG